MRSFQMSARFLHVDHQFLCCESEFMNTKECLYQCLKKSLEREEETPAYQQTLTAFKMT